MTKYYAGVGARDVPKRVFDAMVRLGFLMATKGYVLRSGAASGSDTAFEDGARQIPDAPMELFVPWHGFGRGDYEYRKDYIDIGDIKEETLLKARRLASAYHPNWQGLSTPVRMLMTRNSFQIFGKDMDTPVDMVLCWTADGQASGGTGQAIRIAQDHAIPVINLHGQSFNQVVSAIELASARSLSEEGEAT